MQKEVLDKIAALITAAFGLVAALGWNGAIQEILSGSLRTAERPMGNDFLYSRSYNNSSSYNHTDRAGAAEKATGKKPEKVLDEV